MAEPGHLIRHGSTLIYQSGIDWLVSWMAEIDPVERRLRLSRTRFGVWRKVVVDCPFDECVSVGTVEYNYDGVRSYGAYFKLKSGRFHAIPTRGDSFEGALLVVKQVCAATRLPRLDIRWS